jgi:hypothetical protein
LNDCEAQDRDMASPGPQITLHIAHRPDFAYHLSYAPPWHLITCTACISQLFPLAPCLQRAHTRGGHRHLQIGRMLDIGLISEPLTPPPHPRCMYPKCGNLVARRGRKRFIASWVRMSPICTCTLCPPPPQVDRVIGRRCHFAHLWLTLSFPSCVSSTCSVL